MPAVRSQIATRVPDPDSSTSTVAVRSTDSPAVNVAADRSKRTDVGSPVAAAADNQPPNDDHGATHDPAGKAPTGNTDTTSTRPTMTEMRPRSVTTEHSNDPHPRHARQTADNS